MPENEAAVKPVDTTTATNSAEIRRLAPFFFGIAEPKGGTDFVAKTLVPDGAGGFTKKKHEIRSANGETTFAEIRPAKHFRRFGRVSFASTAEFYDRLVGLAEAREVYVTRTAPAKSNLVFSSGDGLREPGNLPDLGHVFEVDLDGFPMPHGLDLDAADHAVEIGEAIRPFLPEPLRVADFVTQLTTGHGIAGLARLHLWFVGSRPVGAREIRAMLGMEAPAIVLPWCEKPITFDRSVWRDRQPNYLADPVLEGVVDRFAGRRWGFCPYDGLEDAVVAVPPTERLEAEAARLGIGVPAGTAPEHLVAIAERLKRGDITIDPARAEKRLIGYADSVPTPIPTGNRRPTLQRVFFRGLDFGVEIGRAAEVVTDWAFDVNFEALKFGGEATFHLDDGADFTREGLEAWLLSWHYAYKGPWGKNAAELVEALAAEAEVVEAGAEPADPVAAADRQMTEIEVMIDANPALAAFRFGLIDKGNRARLGATETAFVAALFSGDAKGIQEARKARDAAATAQRNSADALAEARATVAARKSGPVARWSGMNDPLDIDTIEERVLRHRRPDVIHGLIPAGVVALFYAPPAMYKTFTALRLAWTAAIGRTLDGREVRRRRVVYVTGEGEERFADRVMALKLDEEAKSPGSTEGMSYWLHVVYMPDLDLLDATAVEKFTADLLALATKRPANGVEGDDEFGLVIFDTLRKLAPSLDEIESPAVSACIAAMQGIGDASGASVVYLHHTNKAGETFRGSSTFLGDSDVVMKISKEDKAETKILSFEKMKDAALPERHRLVIRDIVLGNDPDPAATKPITSQVVDLIPVGASALGEGAAIAVDDEGMSTNAADLREAIRRVSPGEGQTADRVDVFDAFNAIREERHREGQKSGKIPKREPFEPMSRDTFRKVVDDAEENDLVMRHDRRKRDERLEWIGGGFEAAVAED